MKRILAILLLLAACLPQAVQAWWNDGWKHRTQLSLNTAAAGVETRETLTKVPVLVRLHAGNFAFLDAKEDGSDLRFVSGDDKTQLSFHIEKWDPVNELASIWVQLPTLPAAAEKTGVWLYYGNPGAAAETHPKGTYDGTHAAVFHFSESQGLPQDRSANGNHAAGSTALPTASGLIGAGVTLDGSQKLVIGPAPSLKWSAQSGFTFSVWVNFTDPQDGTVLFTQQDGSKSLVIGFKNDGLYARVAGDAGQPLETASGAPLSKGAWHHIAVTVSDKLTLYVDGIAAGGAPAAMPELGGQITLGADSGGFKGQLDELQLASVARSADWIKLAYGSQGPDGKLIAYSKEGEGGAGGEHSYFGVLVDNLTIDAWVVIVILIAMFVVALAVMVGKALLVFKVDRDNRRFLQRFRTASHDFLQLGKHDRYPGSSLFRLYQSGVREVEKRFEANGTQNGSGLSGASISAIKAVIDADMVRENHRLNAQMVLLTIAISGGPFLGLLGTVVGVMITFAAIAAAGDVNVNAIAPGIAAALLATVAGLAVAIPALFGYNYLASRIKNISSDMQIFVDELVTRIAEVHST